MQVLASGDLVLKAFDLQKSGDVSEGYLLLLNPDTLKIEAQQAASVSSARLTIQQSPDGSAYLYHINALVFSPEGN
jgi:hypothetical protein